MAFLSLRKQLIKMKFLSKVEARDGVGNMMVAHIIKGLSEAKPQNDPDEQ